MARRNISRKQHAGRYKKARQARKEINQPGFQVRGGIRL